MESSCVTTSALAVTRLGAPAVGTRSVVSVVSVTEVEFRTRRCVEADWRLDEVLITLFVLSFRNAVEHLFHV
jgi:hypothetical protein